MKYLWKLSVVFVILLFSLMCLAPNAQAATVVKSGKCGDNLTWTFDSENTLTISGTGAMYDYELGTSTYEEPWANLAFSKLVIKSGVTTIGNGAFDDSYEANLKEVSLPSTLTTIGDYAFSYQKFEKIVIPNSVTTIGESAFDGCRNLKEVTLSKKLKKISTSMFQLCYALEELVIPNSVTSIGTHAFYYCNNLTEVTFSSNLKTIGREAFRCCYSLGTIILPDSVTSIGESAFEDCSATDIAYLPAGLEKIPFGMFRGCTSMKAVFFPAALEVVNGSAFADCDALKEIYWLGTEEQLANLKVYGDNEPLYSATVYLVTLITKEPQDVNALAGDEVSFSTATNRTNVTYQWYYSETEDGEWKPCKSTSAKTGTLKFTATESKDGYWYCCEITDPYGNKGSTQAAQLNIITPVQITAQPQSVEAAAGAEAKVTVKANGEGLTYQWYIKNASASKFSKSSITSDTYSVKMASTADGRQVYCKITDKYGNSITSDTVTLTLKKGVTIVTQPKTTYTKSGSTAKVTVKAEGEGLKYQWYIRNASGTKYSKSSITTATYSAKMSSTAKDRRVYCVITDSYGNTVQSKTVILRMAATVTTQPKTTYTKSGSTAKVTVKAAGDDLTYTWYVKNAGADSFSKSSITKSTYSATMSSKSKDRQVYCVVTDKYGKTDKTETVYLRMAATVTTQPKDVTVAKGDTAKVSFKAAGDGLTYTWYVKNAGANSFSKSSVTKSYYSVTMSSKVDGRQVYCKVTDQYGKTVKTNTVTLNMK